jgi:hypothetical protein
MAKLKAKRKTKLKLLHIENSWELEDAEHFFDMGQRYPAPHYLSLDDGFGWLLFNREPETSNERNEALLKFLDENPEYKEGQDFTPEDDEYQEESEW